ncbi:hypothetical protein PVK06_005081 [Gossypium arboreum]|uniref:Uncharacterized protein n=1 Tax=Gossypium arboreum TaxID=29729 RepID=A0ABR0QTN6_GOSAR|nr:hypothetical protein PVK06_005081 [Gossypium arboreum]
MVVHVACKVSESSNIGGLTESGKLITLEDVNTNVELAPLRDNATVTQIKHYSDERVKRYKAMSYIQNGFSNFIFTRVMACEAPKQP